MSDFSTPNIVTLVNSIDTSVDGVTLLSRNDASAPQEMSARVSDNAKHDPELTVNEAAAIDSAEFKQYKSPDVSDKSPDEEGEATSAPAIGGGSNPSGPSLQSSEVKDQGNPPAPAGLRESAKQHPILPEASEAPTASEKPNPAAQPTGTLHFFGKVRTVANCITEQAYTIEEPLLHNGVPRKVSRIGLGIADFKPEKLRALVANEVAGDQKKAKMLEEVIAGLNARKGNFGLIKESAQKDNESSEQLSHGVRRLDRGTDGLGKDFKAKIREGFFDAFTTRIPFLSPLFCLLSGPSKIYFIDLVVISRVSCLDNEMQMSQNAEPYMNRRLYGIYIAFEQPRETFWKVIKLVKGKSSAKNPCIFPADHCCADRLQNDGFGSGDDRVVVCTDIEMNDALGTASKGLPKNFTYLIAHSDINRAQRMFSSCREVFAT
ncbi:hypothetical protein ST47_g3707 [Ascochyta rabiei]|uniref:Uncharacterized protein n=1 Tax=Didymella rabiei TaxID=5454 RepID=A0A163H3K1_DIDRA|nr:hypothetical protein ST47_g3707 [Ascochyta rabiei]